MRKEFGSDDRRFTPLKARARTEFLLVLRGEGRSPMVKVAARSTPLKDVISDVNGMLGRDAYTSAERVALGVVTLRDGGYHSLLGAGATYGIGSLGLDRRPGTTSDAPGEVADMDTAAWLVTEEDGSRSVAAMPNTLDSFEVEEYLRPTFRGRFKVELVPDGLFFANPKVEAPGWTLMVDRSRSLDLAEEATYDGATREAGERFSPAFH